ncbi:MAG: L-histidine N(alpha)-methyltransferase [Alphaproteobacteria bacterium]|nr:L-histidine N(alpha)-methyltransferase [Alphaproteobacteria bacterium]
MTLSVRQQQEGKSETHRIQANVGSSIITLPSQGTQRPHLDEVDRDFVRALEQVMKAVAKAPGKRHSVDLTRFLYSKKIPTGYTRSGSECAEHLFSGISDPLYTIPRAEVRLLDINSKVISSFFSTHFPNTDVTHVSLGCGPYTSVFSKDLLMARLLQAKYYTAIDINKQQAQSAVTNIGSRVHGIIPDYIAQDFTKPIHFKNIPQDNLVVMTMLGDTIAQYTCAKDSLSKKKDKTSALERLLVNFGESTNYSAVLFATLDEETDPNSAIQKYQGVGMKRLMETFWGTAKEVTGDVNFTPCAFEYRPEFDEETSSVLFVHEARKDTSLTIKGKTYPIPKNTEIVIGCSQKTSAEQIIPICKKAGWVPANIQFSYDSTARAVMLLGKNLRLQAPAS